MNTLNKLRISRSQSGFTIVELLIVIVVIAILAAITIVAYNGITARANSSSALATAQSFVKKAEAYNAEEGSYPTTRAQLTSAAADKSYQLPASTFTALSANPTSTSANNAIWARTCGASVGVVVFYYKYDGSDAGVKNLTAGSATSSCSGIANM
jgi:prepilin-type N-terminal cleavage/methylation domain-containing protein